MGEGRFESRIDDSWSVVRGPNGGYVAAIILRALVERLADPGRSPRSFTVHYLSRPRSGPVTIATAVERTGRSVAFLSGRLLQDDELRAIAVATFSAARHGIEYVDVQAPEVPRPEELAPLPRSPEMPPFLAHWDHRHAVGHPPFAGAGEALTGGWMRLVEPRPVDAMLAATLTDAWVPSIFARVGAPATAPTIDLTVHFRRALPVPGANPEDFVLGVFRSRMAHDGFFEEDGELWSSDGLLLAQSRQLALALPASG